jgi:hypothetical protein
MSEIENMPALSYSSGAKRVRDAAAVLLQVAREEGFYVVGAAINEKTQEVMQLRNSKDDFIGFLKDITKMFERLKRQGCSPVRDDVVRGN